MEDLGDQVDYSPESMEDTHIFYSGDFLGVSRALGGSLGRFGTPQEIDGSDCRTSHTNGMTTNWLGGLGFQILAVSQPVFPFPRENANGRVSRVSVGVNCRFAKNSLVAI